MPLRQYYRPSEHTDVELCVCVFVWCRVLQIKRERERSRTEAKNLQQQLSDMHDVLDNTKSTDLKERDTLLQVRNTAEANKCREAISLITYTVLYKESKREINKE